MDNIKKFKDIDQALQNWINLERSNGHNVTKEEINSRRDELIEKLYKTPKPNCHGFTQDQMDEMEFETLEEGCPVGLPTLTEEEILQIPIMRQVLHLMNALSEKELKLTQTGSIPIIMVKALYELGVKSWASDYYLKKIRFSEQRCYEVIVVRAALEGAGLIKKRLGKLSLTARGKKLLKDHNKLLWSLLIYLFSGFGGLDRSLDDPFNEADSGNKGHLFSLWLLHHYGSEWRNIKRYANDYYRAMDFRGDINAYTFRTFDRLFRIIGLCEIREIDKEAEGDGRVRHYTEEEVRKTPILDMMFSFVEPAKI